MQETVYEAPEAVEVGDYQELTLGAIGARFDNAGGLQGTIWW